MQYSTQNTNAATRKIGNTNHWISYKLYAAVVLVVVSIGVLTVKNVNDIVRTDSESAFESPASPHHSLRNARSYIASHPDLPTHNSSNDDYGYDHNQHNTEAIVAELLQAMDESTDDGNTNSIEGGDTPFIPQLQRRLPGYADKIQNMGPTDYGVIMGLLLIVLVLGICCCCPNLFRDLILIWCCCELMN